MKRRLLRILSIISLVAILLFTMAGIALAVDYYLYVKVSSESETSYAPLALVPDLNNQSLADLGYISETGLDTRITYAGSELKHMVAEDKLAFVAPEVKGGVDYSYNYTMGNDPISSFAIIPGYDGYVTVADDAALEPGNNFEIEQKGHIDTAAGSNKDLVLKEGGDFRTYVSDATNITSAITVPIADPVDVTPGTTGDWTDVDVSAYIPSTATGVVVHIDCVTTPLNVGVRKNGSSDNRIVDLNRHGWAMVGVDSSQIFEAYVEDSNPKIYLVAYTDSSVTFFTDGVDKSLGATTTWTDIDCSSEAPSAVGLIFEAVDNGGASFATGMRKNGSADARTNNITHNWFVIGCDAGQVVEGYISDTNIDFFLIGYITAGATFNTNADDKSLGGIGAWTDIDCSAEAPNATHLVFEVVDTVAHEYGFRRNGSSENIYNYIYLHQWVVVECDSGQVVEGKISHTNCDFFLVGYFTSGVNQIASTTSVTAAGVSSGPHTIKTTADGTDLKIYVDTIEKDSTALGGASVPDNANDWTLTQNNVMPYMEYYKHTVGGTLIAWYQPNDMISGATLPDREGTAQNGTITWGSLPTGISTTIGSLKIVNLQRISKETEEGAYLELFQEVPPEWEGMYEGEQYNVLPGSEAISELAAAGQIPIKLFWVPVIFGIAIFAGFALYSKTENIMAVAIAGGIVIGLFCAIGMLAWWVIIPYSIMSVALCVSEKTYGF